MICYYFCFTIDDGVLFITTILSDLHANEFDAMNQLAEICNGDEVEFYVGDDRPVYDPHDYSTFNEMVADVSRTFGQKVSIQYIIKDCPCTVEGRENEKVSSTERLAGSSGQCN